MQLVEVELLDEAAIQPMDNPFLIKAIKTTCLWGNVLLVQTGLKLRWNPEWSLEVESLVKGVFPIGWEVRDALRITVLSDLPYLLSDKPFAKVYIVERAIAPLRFIEKGNFRGDEEKE